MNPQLTHIDHVHIYVRNWAQAQSWYAKILGLRQAENLMPWAVKGGPLTLKNDAGDIHLALFEKDEPGGSSAIAFGTDGMGFVRWLQFLRNQNVEVRVSDHELAYSLYFADPDENLHEITTYDHQYVREHS